MLKITCQKRNTMGFVSSKRVLEQVDTQSQFFFLVIRGIENRRNIEGKVQGLRGIMIQMLYIDKFGVGAAYTSESGLGAE